MPQTTTLLHTNTTLLPNNSSNSAILPHMATTAITTTILMGDTTTTSHMEEDTNGGVVILVGDVDVDVATGMSGIISTTCTLAEWNKEKNTPITITTMAGVGDNNTWVRIAATTAKAIQNLGSDLTICCIVPLVAWTSTMMDGIVQAGRHTIKTG